MKTLQQLQTRAEAARLLADAPADLLLTYEGQFAVTGEPTGTNRAKRAKGTGAQNDEAGAEKPADAPGGPARVPRRPRQRCMVSGLTRTVIDERTLSYGAKLRVTLEHGVICYSVDDTPLKIDEYQILDSVARSNTLAELVQHAESPAKSNPKVFTPALPPSVSFSIERGRWIRLTARGRTALALLALCAVLTFLLLRS